jgi:hypothetical protein
MRLPDGVLELLDPGVKLQTVEPLWKEFRKSYPTEKAAVAAARRNVAVLLPIINTADNIRFNNQILCNELGFDEGERLNIISKNPGVLGNKPGELARSSPGVWRSAILDGHRHFLRRHSAAGALLYSVGDGCTHRGRDRQATVGVRRHLWLRA